LSARGLSVASVETGTGGMLSGRLAHIGAVFHGGIILADGSLIDLAAVIEAAQHIRKERGSDLGLCAAVIAAPEQRGLKLFLALATSDDVKTVERGFGGHTALAGQWASTVALGLVWRNVKDEG
jgi:nicotinamide mononucleotide (NMN) deamidase PncC